MYETLPLSLALHAAAAVAVLAASIWQVAFPVNAPHLMALYQLEALPTPPPPPPPPAAAAKRTPTPQQPVVTRTEDVAPTMIPEFIPLVLPPSEEPVTEVTEGLTGGVEGGVEDGVVGGAVEGGVAGGEVGGTVGGVVGSVLPANTVLVKRDMPLPTAPMSMVYPRYPDEARLRGWEDMVVVRYTIGKDGRVREVIVLDRAEREIFEKTAVKAIRNWRFRPHKVDGVAQEIVHELTIYFRLEA